MSFLIRSLLLFGLSLSAARAEPLAEPEAEIDPLVEDRITVIAHRQPRQLSEIAGTVTVIDREQIERNMAVDLTELVRYEPGVDVDRGGTRFGFNGFRIRGIGGNRTAVVIDNIPAPDRFTVGNFADSGRGLMELGLAQQVEILRGPASTLYGSKALGGVVAVRLLDAQDLVDGSGFGQRSQLALASDSNRVRLQHALAVRRQDSSFLLAGSALSAGEIEVAQRPPGTPVDRLDRRHAAVLSRLARELPSGRIRLSLDGVQESREADLRAMLGSGRLINTSALLGDDERRQWRLLLDQQLAPIGPIARGQWRAWYQDSDTRQDTLDLRPNATVPIEVARRFELRQQNIGLGSDLESEFLAFGRGHRLGYGFELSRTEVRSRRDGLQTRLDTGASTKLIIGERFPLRDFPTSQITELGIYLHDEIELFDGGPRLSAGLRFEYYDLALKRDALFDQSFPEAVITELSTTAWMPRLGLVWPLNDRMELFAQYARGFRAPPFDDVNIGLEYAQFQVRAIANPDLRPERGRTLEAGLRWRGVDTRAELSLFRNQYRDFIQSRAPLGLDPASGFTLFQSINRDRVLIEGFEFRLQHELGGGFRSELGGEWTRGEDMVSGRPLASIGPPRLIAELAWQSADGRWETRLIGSATRAQRELLDEQDQPLFSAPAHFAIDWLTRWAPHPELSIGLGLFNLGDRRYWLSSSVAGRAPSDPSLPLLAQPGRSAMLSLEWRR